MPTPPGCQLVRGCGQPAGPPRPVPPITLLQPSAAHGAPLAHRNELGGSLRSNHSRQSNYRVGLAVGGRLAQEEQHEGTHTIPGLAGCYVDHSGGPQAGGDPYGPVNGGCRSPDHQTFMLVVNEGKIELRLLCEAREVRDLWSKRMIHARFLSSETDASLQRAIEELRAQSHNEKMGSSAPAAGALNMVRRLFRRRAA